MIMPGILPEVFLSSTVLILVVYGFRWFIWKVTIVMLSLVGLLSFLYCLMDQEWIPMADFGVFIPSSLVVLSKCLLGIASFSLLISSHKKQDRGEGDFWIWLVLIVLLGSCLLVSSGNWGLIFLALELQTLSFFILVANQKSTYSAEAGLKYLVLGAVFSGFFLFGCALLYGISGETSVQGIHSVLMGEVGKVFITISLLFKLSAAPFHMWAPDVYEGAPTITTALLATLPKIGVFTVLIQVGFVSNVVMVCGVFSITYGAVGALNQTKIKRLLAYSGIGHLGFILFGVGMGSFEGLQSSIIYLFLYIVMSVCVFSVLLSFQLDRVLILEVCSLSRENVSMACTLGVAFFSTAGIPPLSGFFGKWCVLLSGMSRGYYLICLAVVLASVIAGVYYVRMVRVLYFTDAYLLTWQKCLNRLEVIKFRQSLPLGAAFYIVVWFMLSPNWMLQMAHEATMSLYL